MTITIDGVNDGPVAQDDAISADEDTVAAGNVLAMMPHPERAAQLRHVPEDLPHAWGRARRAAAGEYGALESPGPGAFLLRRLVEMC